MAEYAPPPRDPRSIITPDAFEVSPELLGLPLAPPSKRLGALLIDFAVVGAITLLTKSFALILGVVVAVLFVREGFKRTPVRGSVFGRAMRLSVGCLGVGIGLITMVTWVSLGIGGGMGDRDRGDSDIAEPGIEDARATRAEIDVLADPSADTVAEASVASLLTDSTVADTLRKLESRIADLVESDESGRETVRELRDALRAEREGGGLFTWLRGVVDELGFGFGWASLYLTVMLSWWKGKTVGKRIMKIRVLRLDGEPITWWTAFERAGGYAAGLATGLLGFAQVYWDANRQAIHDRIVGTVVVVDGGAKETP